ncbi:MAG TPA: leucyl aminopeptidase, partial [Agromyces sp.]
MTVPELSYSTASAIDSDADVVLLAARSTDEGAQVLAPAEYDWVAPLLGGLGASGAVDELTRIPAQGDGPAVV